MKVSTYACKIRVNILVSNEMPALNLAKRARAINDHRCGVSCAWNRWNLSDSGKIRETSTSSAYCLCMYAGYCVALVSDQYSKCSISSATGLEILCTRLLARIKQSIIRCN